MFPSKQNHIIQISGNVNSANLQLLILYTLYSLQTSSSSVRHVMEQRENVLYGSGNNDITMLTAVENFDLDSSFVDVSPTGVSTAQSCTVLYCTEGYGAVTLSVHPQISHRCHSDAGHCSDWSILKFERLPFNCVMI